VGRLHLIFVFVAVASTWLPFAQGQALDAGFCDPDKAIALSRAAVFHELAEREMYQQRGLPREDQNAVDFDELAKRFVSAKRHSALLVYTWSPTDICLFAWFSDTEKSNSGTTDLIYVRLPNARQRLLRGTDELRALVSTWRFASSRAPRSRGFEQVDEPALPARLIDEVALDMSDTLFPPEIRDDLARVDTLSIMPVGPISTIPLAMLQPLGDGRISAELFSVNILSKIDDLRIRGYAWSAGFAAPLVFGNPSPNDPEWEFPDLPAAQKEAETVHQLFGGELFVGKAATSVQFQRFAPLSDLIVIAAHGIADLENPIERSFLALTDARLTPRMIQAQKLRSSPIVVLSACQSGLGRALDAGIIGIARSFQVMGAANTVMSLWNVDDKATEYLMDVFYGELPKWGPAEALRRAVLHTRQHYPDPSKWAAFLTFGAPTVKWN
jgi:hypothetical protein